MFLSFSRNYILKLLVICLVVFIIQINLPEIIIYNNFKINLDLFLIFFTISVFIKPTFLLIIFAFIFGLINDIILNIEQVGLMSFIKSLTVYLLLYIRNYDTIWSWHIKIFYIFLIYFFHFNIYYLIIYDSYNIYISILSIIQALLSIFIFYVFNKLFFNIK